MATLGELGGELIRASAFVGQATSKKSGSKGQTQKEQQEAVAKLKSGAINVLVATCIAEEGLDVGEVDLIVHFDVVTSSTRSVQRNGRTGRKRPGRVVQLYVATEENRIKKAQQQANAIKRALGGKTKGRGGRSSKKLNFMVADYPVIPDGRRPMMKSIDLGSIEPLDLKQVRLMGKAEARSYLETNFG